MDKPSREVERGASKDPLLIRGKTKPRADVYPAYGDTWEKIGGPMGVPLRDSGRGCCASVTHTFGDQRKKVFSIGRKDGIKIPRILSSSLEGEPYGELYNILYFWICSNIRRERPSSSREHSRAKHSENNGTKRWEYAQWKQRHSRFCFRALNCGPKTKIRKETLTPAIGYLAVPRPPSSATGFVLCRVI
ncbi:hypothetical protein HPP92_000410 [Vanilla planifolia]|uniref:Uncharacterized protein n=1 Tax=Vanilla planifolia TaxID=51239 RepID=A0A835S0J9_VANPL|nr:hypothetical protein HPP92_000410 [Vanilla planifolia]